MWATLRDNFHWTDLEMVNALKAIHIMPEPTKLSIMPKGAQRPLVNYSLVDESYIVHEGPNLQ